MSPLSLFTDIDTRFNDVLAQIQLRMAQLAGTVEVLGCSTIAGNTDVEQTTRNTLRMWEWLKLPVPVASGAAKPLINPLSTAPLIHGYDGLGNS